MSYLAIMSGTESHKQQEKKRNYCLQVHFCLKVPILKMSLHRLMPSQGPTYIPPVKVCLCTEINDGGSIGSGLDTQKMGVPCPPRPTVSTRGLSPFFGRGGLPWPQVAVGLLSIRFQMAFKPAGCRLVRSEPVPKPYPKNNNYNGWNTKGRVPVDFLLQVSTSGNFKISLKAKLTI